MIATHAPAFDPIRSYAEWFTWARRHVEDAGRCHAAAGAALRHLAAGGQTADAAHAAQAAAAAPTPEPPIADAPTQAYAGWHAAGILQLGLDNEHAHAAARAATDAQLRGATVEQAAAAGRAAAGLVAQSQPVAAGGLSWTALIAEPAVRGIGWGVLCLIIPFVAHFYFPILPVFGLVYGVRALGRGNPVLGMVGLAVNGLALALNAVIFFGLVH